MLLVHIMASIKVEVSPDELTSDNEFSTKEQKPDKTPDKRHVDVLLDVSEEDFINDLEPHEYHCYHGWEEAVSKCLLCSSFSL